ncbi:MAG: NACHT domain-containing protein [Oryzomonas sp.]|jgi:hypothetical protein
MAGTAALLGTAKALSFVMKDLYEEAKGGVKKHLARWNYTKNVNNLYKSIFDVRNVKTIWKTDRKVNLMSFYYPSKIIIDSEPLIINALNKIPSSNNIIIEGTVGQGKSIFLRYLCSQELTNGNRLPIFLQLRKIIVGETLKEKLFSVFDSLNFDINDELFDYLAKEDKLVLFLDGFDEISENIVAGVGAEIEHLSQKYNKLKIVITSRPKSGLENSQYFDVYKLAPLTQNDHKPFLHKLIKDIKKVNEVEEAIKKSDTNIFELLRTPLMMTLLIFLYQSEQKIPKQLSEFYENLFPLLFYKHDKAKLGFSRKRSCNLNERDMQKIFEAFCYISRKNDLTEFKEGEILKFSEEAIKLNNLDCNVRGYVDDITKISCLVIEEGLSYHLIHKSVQEYHAACFIMHRPEEFAIKFYERMISEKYKNWENELRFLAQMDTYRFNKYYLIPDIDNMFEYLDISYGNSIKLTIDKLSKIIKSADAVVDESGKYTGYSLKRYTKTRTEVGQNLITIFHKYMREKKLTNKVIATAKYKTINLIDYINTIGCTDILIAEFQKNLIYFKDIRESALQYLKREKQNDVLLP